MKFLKHFFLKPVLKYSRQKIFFVTDGHPAHKTKKLNEWLSENTDRIEVFFLPPSSPELNPQEYVNQDVKTNMLGKKRPMNKAQMRNNVESFMQKDKMIKSRCRNILTKSTSDMLRRDFSLTILLNAK